MNKKFFSETNNLSTILQKYIETIKYNCIETKFTELVKKNMENTNSLIDICIKNKINYFIDNNISFSSIKFNFLIKFEQILFNLIEKENNEIKKNILDVSYEKLKNIETIEEWNELFKILFRKNDEKNKVSFNPTTVEYTYDLENSNITKINKKTKSIKINFENDDIEIPNNYKISLFLKIIYTHSLNGDEFLNNIYDICKIIYEPLIEYNVLKPYEE